MKILNYIVLFLCLSCGSGDIIILKDIVYSVSKNKIEVGAEFDSFLDLELEMSVAIKEYGTLNFIPPSREKGSIISFSLDKKIFKDEEYLSLKKTRKLPNGGKMSNYIEKDLLWLKFKKRSKGVKPSLYLGTDTDDFYLGSAIELNFIDEDFPNITISQRFKDTKGRYLGVLTFFGPKFKKNGDLKYHGGFFFATNISDLARYLEEDSKEKTNHREIIGEPLEIREDGELISMEEERAYYLMKTLSKKVREFNKEQKK